MIAFPEVRIAIFAKAPIAGQTKTRLQPLLTTEQAATLQLRLTRHMIDIACASQCADIELWCAPDSQHSTFRELARQYPVALRQQQGSDLGQRMLYAFENNSKTYQATLLIGTDCPYLRASDLQQSLATIVDESYDVAINPAMDGGYVAIAANAAYPELFTNIEWGTPQVYQQSCQYLQQSLLRWCELNRFSDIDRPDDYLDLIKQYPAFKV